MGINGEDGRIRSNVKPMLFWTPCFLAWHAVSLEVLGCMLVLRSRENLHGTRPWRIRLLPCLAAPGSMATQKLDKLSFVPLKQRSISCFVAFRCYIIYLHVYLHIYIYTYWYIVLQHIYLYRCVLYNNILIISIYTRYEGSYTILLPFQGS